MRFRTILLLFVLASFVSNVFALEVLTSTQTLPVIEKSRQEKLIAMLNKSQQHSNVKHLFAKIVKMQDSAGLVYVGAEVNKADLSVYLEQMKKILGLKNYQTFRANQTARDQQSFHLTLINPYEYQSLVKTVEFDQMIKITLHGLGQVKMAGHDKKQQSFFVIASSVDGQYFRQKHLLKQKDFHITLGFDPQDIYTMSKGVERLIKVD